jgi:hypothetical protein
MKYRAATSNRNTNALANDCKNTFRNTNALANAFKNTLWLIFCCALLTLICYFSYELYNPDNQKKITYKQPANTAQTNTSTKIQFDFYHLLSNAQIKLYSVESQKNTAHYAYILRISAYSKKKYADAMLIKLQKLAITGYIREYKNKDTLLYLVEVGPLSARSEISFIQDQLAAGAISSNIKKINLNNSINN